MTGPTATVTAAASPSATVAPTIITGTEGTKSSDTPTGIATSTATATPAATSTPTATWTATPDAIATLYAAGTAFAITNATATANAAATATAGAATATAVVQTAAAGTAAAIATATAYTAAAATADAGYYATATAYAAVPTSTPTPSAVAPANDDFGSATQIGSLPYSTGEDTSGATLASDDPDMGAGAGQNSATVWYSFAAAQGGRVDVNTADSSYDTVLAVFTGSRGALHLVAANDDTGDTRQSDVAFDVQSGTTYYIEVAGYGNGGGGQMKLSVAYTTTPGTTTPTATSTAALPGTPTTTPAGLRSPTEDTQGVIPPYPATSDPRYFQQTGYRINNDAFWDYFQRRGGLRTFGYPISRQFLLMGFQVQLFQRELLQQMPDGSVATMNLLDPGMMPYTLINGSTFPGQDEEMVRGAPQPKDPSYGDEAIAFVQSNVPDEWEGKRVNFLHTFLSTVRYEDAFPQGEADPALVPLLNLEIWGLPTSRPAYDPNNHNFVYQRFQRGIMHYDAATGVTQGLLLGDYFKSIITGQNLPHDLDQEARLSFFYRQYDRSRPGYLARPADLRGTNLVGAFEMDVPQ
jgi:hypothetical protein